MTDLQAHIAEALLPGLDGVTIHEKWLNCAQAYPWYPLPWLMLADKEHPESLQKAALWFSDEQRVHWLVTAKANTEDAWLQEQLALLERAEDETEAEVLPPDPEDYQQDETEAEQATDIIATELEEEKEKEFAPDADPVVAAVIENEAKNEQAADTAIASIAALFDESNHPQEPAPPPDDRDLDAADAAAATVTADEFSETIPVSNEEEVPIDSQPETVNAVPVELVEPVRLPAEEASPDVQENDLDNAFIEPGTEEKEAVHADEVAVEINEPVADVATSLNDEPAAVTVQEEEIKRPGDKEATAEAVEEQGQEDPAAPAGSAAISDVYEEQAPLTETSTLGTPAETEAGQTPISPIPGLSDLNREAPYTPAPLFEPFHSVDYFASQGIKLDLNAEPKTKFDRQLMSFTQWLKVMKKVTKAEAEVANDPVVDAQASASISEKEVHTEAMAEVLEKQGKFGKAAEIYEKLLLLHPEKSAFFAARIQELKNK